MSVSTASVQGTGLVLGPLEGTRRLQLRRLIRQMPGVHILGQAFSLQHVHALIEAHHARVLLLDNSHDLRTLWPLPACVHRCIVLDHAAAPDLSRPALKLLALQGPADLEQVQAGDGFFMRLSHALGAGPVTAADTPTPPAPATSRTVPASAFRILAIGASTGGPEALSSVLQPLAGRLPVPIVITQHIGSGFSGALAQSLAQRSGLPVHEAQQGQVLQDGHVYLAPANRHLLVRTQQGRLLATLDDGPPECFCKPSVDTMLRSLATSTGARTLVLMLTGMGQDGLAGARQVHEAGGCILAQDQASSVVWGMPGAVVNAGLCKAVLPPAALAQKVLRELGDTA